MVSFFPFLSSNKAQFCHRANYTTRQGYADNDSEGGLEENLAARGYRSLLVNDDYDSEYDE